MGNRIELSCECLNSESSIKNIQPDSCLYIKNPSRDEVQIMESPNPNVNELSPQMTDAILMNPRHKSKKQLTIHDFVVVRCIGKGAFGKVLLVKKLGSQKLYAMKIIKKIDVFDNNLEQKIVLEKYILAKNRHPFIVDLKYAFQTSHKIYLIMEFMPGGELFQLLKRIKHFTEEYARFYLVEVLLALEHLHTKMNVIYRDLKPENILLSENGHIKITDFGLSKVSREGKAFSIVGTIEYLAPEIIKNLGHSYAVDYWSLGILFFEMLAGYPPFTADDRNVKIIQQRILENKPEFPSFFSTNSVDLIKKLLVIEPENRLGFININEIKNHKFFDGVNWDDFKLCKVDAPFKVSNFASRRMVSQEHELTETIVSVTKVFPHIQGITYDIDHETFLTNETDIKIRVKDKETSIILKENEQENKEQI